MTPGLGVARSCAHDRCCLVHVTLSYSEAQTVTQEVDSLSLLLLPWAGTGVGGCGPPGYPPAVRAYDRHGYHVNGLSYMCWMVSTLHLSALSKWENWRGG